jgi:acyl-CoA hydrolase
MPGSASEITLRFLAAPTDAGRLGNVDGGRVLERIDKAGYACAVGWSGTYSVTAYVGNVRFSQPVRVGHLVQATARLVNTGRSSMQVLVTVESGAVQDRILSEATGPRGACSPSGRAASGLEQLCPPPRGSVIAKQAAHPRAWG